MVEIARCLTLGHGFDIIGKDSTPMKKSLVCRECGLVAAGIDTASWGQWRRRQVETKEPDYAPEP